jgi:multiple sugar transport system ATP-binding protein
MNFIDAEVAASDPTGVKVVLPGGGSVVARVAGNGVAKGDKVKLGIRPEHLAEGSGDGSISGEVEVVEQLGESHFLYVRTADGRLLTVRAVGDSPIAARTKVSLGLPGEACHVFQKDGTSLQRLMQ